MQTNLSGMYRLIVQLALTGALVALIFMFLTLLEWWTVERKYRVQFRRATPP